MADSDPFRFLLDFQRLPVDSVRDYNECHRQVLWGLVFFCTLDVNDLHGTLYTAHLARIVVLRQEGLAMGSPPGIVWHYVGSVD